MQLWSLGQTKEEVDSGLARIKTKMQKMTALKAQLNFSKTVFRQKVQGDTNVFNFSKSVDNKRKS